MKCVAACLELRLGDTCGRCGGLVDVKKPAPAFTVCWCGSEWGPSGWRLLPKAHCPVHATRPLASELEAPPMNEQQAASLAENWERYRRGDQPWPKISVLAPPVSVVDTFSELARLDEAYGCTPAAMAEGPPARAADDPGIYDAMRELMQREGRWPSACEPGKHDFVWQALPGRATEYRCRICGQGKAEDGR